MRNKAVQIWIREGDNNWYKTYRGHILSELAPKLDKIILKKFSAIPPLFQDNRNAVSITFSQRTDGRFKSVTRTVYRTTLEDVQAFIEKNVSNGEK